MKCLMCNDIDYQRGLCRSCYCKALYQVNAGITTWHELIEAKRALPKKIGRPNSPTREKSEIALLFQGPDKRRDYKIHLQRVRERIICQT